MDKLFYDATFSVSLIVLSHLVIVERSGYVLIFYCRAFELIEELWVELELISLNFEVPVTNAVRSAFPQAQISFINFRKAKENVERRALPLALQGSMVSAGSHSGYGHRMYSFWIFQVLFEQLSVVTSKRSFASPNFIKVSTLDIQIIMASRCQDTWIVHTRPLGIRVFDQQLRQLCRNTWSESSGYERERCLMPTLNSSYEGTLRQRSNETTAIQMHVLEDALGLWVSDNSKVSSKNCAHPFFWLFTNHQSYYPYFIIQQLFFALFTNHTSFFILCHWFAGFLKVFLFKNFHLAYTNGLD